MDVREIVEQYLRDNGYDGLCGEECGCRLEDGIMPCDEGYSLHCEAGYAAPCDGTCDYPNACPWHITTEKPKEKP